MKNISETHRKQKLFIKSCKSCINNLAQNNHRISSKSSHNILYQAGNSNRQLEANYYLPRYMTINL